MRRSIIALASVALGALAASSAAAQAVNPAAKSATVEDPATDQGGLDTIIVYAQKKGRGEELQKVPLAVTAVDGAALERAHTTDIRDVGRLVPNAQLDGVGTFPGFANFFMRGVGVSTSVRSLDPAVNIVQDGMVIGYQAGAVLDTFDTETVEVLRGPQGVLFGRNASGGVVSLRSRRPNGNFGGSAKVTFGNSGTVETRSAIEGALIPDILFARIAVLTRENDGFFRNTNDGAFVVIPSNVNPTGAAAALHPVSRVPRTDEAVYKATVVFKPTETTTFTLLGQYLDFNDGGGANRGFYTAGTPLRQLQTVWGYTPSNRKWAVNNGTTGYTNIEGYHIIGELEQKVGRGVFTGIGAYRHISYNATLNVGGDPFDTLVFPDNKEDADQLSFEARYNLPLGDNVDLLLGGFYFKLDTSVYEKRLQRFGTTTNRRYTINRWTQNTESYAVFGNIDVRPIERLTLSAGVRYSKDKKKMRIVPLTICPGQSFESCPLNFLNAEKSWDDVSPRFVASYEFTNHIMAFASYSKGYRAGNFNARAPTAGGAVTPANPEKVSSYEVGIKSDLLDKRLRLNLGYFYQKYDDIQRLVQFAVQGESPSQQLFNAAAATIQGAELEVAAEPIKGLRIDGTVGYTNAKYDSFKNLTGLPAGVSPTDLKFDRVPKWTAYIGATYNTHIGENNTLGAHIGYSWRSHVFVDVLNTRFLEQPQYGLLDASLELGIKQFTFGVFARNLANVEYAEIKSAGIGYNAFGGSPRFYGIEFGVKF